MDTGGFVALCLFAAVTACILVPIYLRNLLYRKTLDTVAKAIEHGIEPERIAVQLPSQQREREDDPNGNWKAGVILIAIGLAFLLAVVLPLWLFGEPGKHDDVLKMLSIPTILTIVGAAFLLIHRSIVGPVVTLAQQRERSRQLRSDAASRSLSQSADPQGGAV